MSNPKAKPMRGTKYRSKESGLAISRERLEVAERTSRGLRKKIASEERRLKESGLDTSVKLEQMRHSYKQALMEEESLRRVYEYRKLRGNGK